MRQGCRGYGFDPLGETVIRQGDPGDYYYVLRDGRFAVSRKDEQGKMHLLTELAKGGVFGEESLISGEARNASVAATADGTMMRLAKQHFDELLKKPLLVHVSLEEARAAAQAGAGLLDVRAGEESRKAPLKGAVSIPLSQLRERLESLNRSRRYIICCRTGIPSHVAAFVMRQRGFDVVVLKGGIEANLKRNP
jgi:CRP-like cAMP-binding protein